MANRVIRKIIDYERIYNGKKTAKTAFAMAMRYYAGYAVSHRHDFLHKAAAVLAPYAGSPDVGVGFLRAHIACEMGNIDQAEGIIAAMGLYARR